MLRTKIVVLLSLLIPFPAVADDIPFGERLKNLAPSNFAVGGTIHPYDGVEPRAHYRAVAEREFNAITATVYMPWGGWIDEDSRPYTEPLLEATTWARQRDQRVHGHVLVYPSANLNLSWYQNLDNNQVEATLNDYVDTMARSTAGNMWVWDVVNEVIGDSGELSEYDRGNATFVDADGVRKGLTVNGQFRPYKEYSAMGQSYIDKAFRWAEQADPNALLIINDYGAEEINAKSDKLLAFSQKLRARGVPIDGVGFQMHWIDFNSEPNYDSIRANFKRFADAGFQLFVTEMDAAVVHTMEPVADSPSNDQLDRQRRVYEKLIRIALEESAVKSWFLWDFADDQSWLHPTRNPLGDIPTGTYMYPTPFWGGDDELQYEISAKPAYYGMQYALARHSAPGNACDVGNAALRRELRPNRWALLSLPCVPPTGTGVAQLFGDDLPGVQGVDWTVFSFDAIANRYVEASANTTLAIGDAFWIIHTSNSSQLLDLPTGSLRTPLAPVSSRCATANCADVLLSGQLSATEWNMIGFPFDRTAATSNIRVSTPNGQCNNRSGCTVVEASNVNGANLISTQMWRYDDLRAVPTYVNAFGEASLSA